MEINVSKTCRKKIIESYLKKKKFSFNLIIVFLFLIIINCSFFYALDYIGDYLKDNAKNICGDYQFKFFDLEKEEVEQIAKDELCCSTAIYQMIGVYDDLFISTTEDYFDLDNSTIIQGEFPQDAEHVLCDKNVLYKYGYTDSEMIGATIIVGEDAYEVSGVIESSIEQESSTIGKIICNSEYVEFNLLYYIEVKTYSDNYKNAMNEIIEKYNIDESKIFENESYLYLSYRTNTDKPARALLIGYIFMLIVSISIVSTTLSVIMLSNYQIEKINKIYIKLGIGRGCILKAYINTLLGMLLTVFIVDNCIISLVLRLITGKIETTLVMQCLIYQIVIYIIPIVIISIVIFKGQLKKGFEKKLKIKEKRFDKNNKLVEGKNLYIQLAKQNNIYGKLRSTILIIPMIMTGVLFVYSLFACDRLKDSLYEKNDYKYSLTYAGQVNISDMENYVKKIFMIEDELKKIDNVEFVPIYMDFEYLTVNAEDLSKKYIDIISNADVGVKMQFSGRANTSVKVPVKVIGIRPEDYDLLGISESDAKKLDDEHCILLDSVSVGNGFEIKSGLEKGDTVKLKYTEDGGNVTDRLEIINSYDKIKIALTDDENEINILVNYEVLDSYLFQSIPEIVYIDCSDGDCEQVMDILKGNSDIDITDIEKVNSELDAFNKLIKCVMITIIVLILLFSIINIYLIIKLKFNEIRKQCVILRALGISDKNIMLVFVYDIIKVFLISIVFVAVISCFTCYNLMTGMDSIRIYVMYYLPYDKIIELLIFYAVILVGFTMVLRKNLLNINIVEELKRDK